MRSLPTSAGVMLVAAVLTAGCGDALSSLELLHQGDHTGYRMLLEPDFGRQGERLAVSVDFAAELESLLAGQVSYPTELAFGPGVQIEYFGPGTTSRLEIMVRIDSEAATGERRPSMSFSTREGTVTAEGRFWVLPPQAE